jgi:AAA domain
MSGFRKAKAEQAALKVAIYGPPGSGKTLTTLLCAEGLAARDGKRVAYVDTEHGTDFYCQHVPERPVHPEAFDFDAIYTRSLMEVIREVKSLDPAQYGVVVIDSITHLWEAARAAYAGKQTKIGTIPMQAWGSIKKPYKELLSILLSSPMHVFILGRQGTEYATDEETDELKSIGVKMKAEGETPYEPHILLRMEAVKPRKTNTLATIVAYAEKDRTGVLSGRSFTNPTFDSLCVPLLGLLGGSQAQIKSDAEVANADAEAIERDEHNFAANSAELMRTFCARIDLVTSAAALKVIGDGITPKIKAKMLPDHLAVVRQKYLGKKDFPSTDVDEDMAEKDKWKDEFGKALADPSGEKAAELLAHQLGQRTKIMGLT